MSSGNTSRKSAPVKEALRNNNKHVTDGGEMCGEVPKYKSACDMLSTVGVSGVLGAAVGVASRRLTSDALYGAGLAIIALQSLSYMGYIQINWKRVEQDITNMVDQNGDGKIDNKDLNVLLKRFLRFAGSGLSDIGAFTGGFFFGAKYLA
ncbi:FUN14 [Trypanosoma melophagium]|uniref:FUN14 n=1 Tax=Trypanosoma melophagium TaxID=715481 RepID=UPI00351A34DE|nr:FUN14 [Trypanosoma melophagium]